MYHTIGGAEDGKLLQTDLDRLCVGGQVGHGVQPSKHAKCQVVHVTSSKTLFNIYTLHGQVLEVVTSAKYSRGLAFPVAYPGISTWIV